MFTSAAHPFESTVGTLHSFNVMLLPTQTTPMILLYAGEPMKKNEYKLSSVPQWTPTGKQTVQTQRSSNNDGVCSIPHL